MLLEDTPAVPLGNLCEDHGHSYHWTSGQKPPLIKNGRRKKCTRRTTHRLFVHAFTLVFTYISDIFTAGSRSSYIASRINKKWECEWQSTERPVAWTSRNRKLRKQQRSTVRPVAWPARMVRRVYGEPCGWKCSSPLGHPRVLLVNQVQSREQKWYRESTVCLLISRRTEIATSAWEPKITWAAEDVLVQSCPEWIFCDSITADLNEGCESRHDHRYAVVVQDLATQWIQSYPCKTKSSQETQKSFMKFLEPTRKPKVIYTVNNLEFGRACEDLSWNHCTWTPRRSETSGIAERAVGRYKEGTSAVVLQSGLDEDGGRILCSVTARSISVHFGG